LILESADAALARGARIYGEIAGYAITNEGYNLTAPRPNGSGMALTMRHALRHSGVTANEVDYINAHGTSTVQNDMYETMAVKDVFGERAYDIPVSSLKSMIGHTAGACGAIAAAITAKSLEEGVVTPTINYVADPALDLDYVPNVSRPHESRVALTNSFGFGGCNATIVLRRFEPDSQTPAGREKVCAS
jgi:3-oxoacyl-[acyl-carrier-protein] synthase II